MFLGTLYRWFDNTWQEINLLFHSDLCSKAFILVQVIWSHLALTKCIPFEPMLLGRHTCTSDSITLRRNIMNPFISDLNTRYRNLMYHSTWQTHLGRHTCKSDFNTFGRYLMYHCIFTKARRQTYLYKCFVQNYIILFWPTILGRYTFTSELITLGRNIWIILFWHMILGRHTWTSDFSHKEGTKCIIPFWPIFYRQTYLYKLTTRGRKQMYHSMQIYAVCLTYLYKWFDHTRQELNISFFSKISP
jgi:hypothetical protein